MNFRLLVTVTALAVTTSAALAQTVVVTPTPNGGAIITPDGPGVVTGASRGTPLGTNADPATAIPRVSETPGNSGALGGQTAEQHEKFGN